MEITPWYKSAIIRQQIVAFLIAGLGLLKLKTDIDIDATVGAILAGIGALIPIYTIITRVFKPAPNLSVAAVEKEKELVAQGKIAPSPIVPLMQRKQGGYGLPSLMVLGFALGYLAMALVGCVSTQAAYKAAPLHGEALVDTAYVLAEHYDGVLIEANTLKDSGRVSPAIVEQMRAADRIARPIFLGDPAKQQPGIMQLRAAYVGVHDAKTEAELQRATNDAARALAALINAVKTARGN